MTFIGSSPFIVGHAIELGNAILLIGDSVAYLPVKEIDMLIAQLSKVKELIQQSKAAVRI